MNCLPNELYLPDDLYDAVVARLIAAMPLLGTRDELMQRLGEIANIWPTRVQPEPFPAEFLRVA